MPAVAASGVTARSGRDGRAIVGGIRIPRLKNWSVSDATSESAWGDSDSLGYTNRARARRDCTGTLVGAMDDDSSLWQVLSGIVSGRVLSITLWENGSGTNRFYFPSALIQSVDLTYDQDSQEVVEWSLTFGADGQFAEPRQADSTLVSGGSAASYNTTA